MRGRDASQVPEHSKRAKKSAGKMWDKLWCGATARRKTRRMIKHLALDYGDPYGTRTRVFAVRVVAYGEVGGLAAAPLSAHPRDAALTG